MYAITISNGGYVITDENLVVVVQDFDPSREFVNSIGQPFESEQAAHAHAVLALQQITGEQAEPSAS